MTKDTTTELTSIATTGNATDFGDLTATKQGVSALCNNHGGVS